MTRDDTATARLVEALDNRLQQIDAVACARVVAWAQETKVPLAELRVLLALAARDRPSPASDLTDYSGLSLDSIHPMLDHLRGRDYVAEEHRRYRLTDTGQELIAGLDAARRAGLRAYIAGLSSEERLQVEQALGLRREGT